MQMSKKRKKHIFKCENMTFNNSFQYLLTKFSDELRICQCGSQAQGLRPANILDQRFHDTRPMLSIDNKRPMGVD